MVGMKEEVAMAVAMVVVVAMIMEVDRQRSLMKTVDGLGVINKPL